MKTYTKTIAAPRLVIKHDENATNPREIETCLGHFITCETRSSSPDRDKILESIVRLSGEESENLAEHQQKITDEMEANGYGKVLATYPIFKIEHGNVAYKLGSSFDWDSSNCGFYIVTDQTLKNMPEPREEWDRIIKDELDVYTSWANGEVYCFTLYDENGKEEESFSGGFYSLNSVKDELGKEWKSENMEDYLDDNA